MDQDRERGLERKRQQKVNGNKCRGRTACQSNSIMYFTPSHVFVPFSSVSKTSFHEIKPDGLAPLMTDPC